MVGLVRSLKAALEAGCSYDLQVGKVKVSFLDMSHVRLTVPGGVGRAASASYDLWNGEQVDAAQIRARYRLRNGGYAAGDEISALNLVAEVFRG